MPVNPSAPSSIPFLTRRAPVVWREPLTVRIAPTTQGAGHASACAGAPRSPLGP
jgi:hypothetical protein